MGRYELLLTARARSDLLAAREWLSQPGSGLKARLRIARITRALVELQFTPHRWAAGEHEGTRQRHVEGYHIIYQADDAAAQVRVLRIFGPYQDRSSL